MHIFLSRLIWRNGELETAIARHIPEGIMWIDTLSGDGKTVASEISGEISAEVVAAINADGDVLDHFYKADVGAPLTEEETTKVQQSAARHGIPMDAMPASPTVADVAEAVKRRMLLSQVIANGDFETAERIEKRTIERLRNEGFDMTAVDPGDDPKTRMAKAQKKAPPGG